jgi:antitoxin ParD1/3/4
MATMNISLPEPMKTWVEQQAQSGRYSNTSDYVRDLIRRDQERAAGIAELQTLITEGFASGKPVPFDRASFLARVQQLHGR